MHLTDSWLTRACSCSQEIPNRALFPELKCAQVGSGLVPKSLSRRTRQASAAYSLANETALTARTRSGSREHEPARTAKTSTSRVPPAFCRCAAAPLEVGKAER